MEEKLKGLKEKARDADQQLSEGKISQEKYDSLQAEIKETEDELKALKDEAKAVNDEFGNPVAPEQYDALQREIHSCGRIIHTSITSIIRDMSMLASIFLRVFMAISDKIGENLFFIIRLMYSGSLPCLNAL